MSLGTGTIKLSEVKTEFGGTTLLSHLKGAGYVAAHENNYNVPTSGTIKLGDFRSNTTFLVDKDFEGVGYVDGFYSYQTGPATPYNPNPTGVAIKGVTGTVGTFGAVNFIGKSKSSTANTELVGVFDYTLDYVFSPPPDTTDGYLYFSGDQTSFAWYSITISGIGTFYRTSSFTSSTGTYNAGTDSTRWVRTGGFGFDGTGSFDITITL